MSDYTQNVYFEPKDSLTAGDPAKKIKGLEVDGELDEIATAIASKENTVNKGAASGYASLDSGTKVPVSQLPAATESAVGAVELATTAEVVTGTDTTRGTTAAGVKAALDALRAAPAFTGNASISSTEPTLYWTESDAGVNAKTWRALASGGAFYLQAMQDDLGGGSTLLGITRTGTTVDAIAFAATTMTFNGVSINSAAGLTAGTIPDARIQSTGVTQHQASLTIAETQITDGSVLARIGANETISGTWTYTNLTINGTVSGNTTFGGNLTMSGTVTKSGAGKFPYFGSATQSSGIITIGTAAVSGTPAAGDIYIQHAA